MIVLPFVICMWSCTGTSPSISDTQTPITDTDSVQDSGVDTGDQSTEYAAIVINEIVTDNTLSLDDQGNTSDWLELYNPTDNPVSLAGYSISDDWTDPQKHVLDASMELAPGAHLLLWASGSKNSSNKHLPFRLNNDGEAVGLFAPDGSSINWIAVPSMSENAAYARIPDGSADWRVVEVATPEAPNTATTRTTISLVETGSTWRYLDTDTVAVDWMNLGFNDGPWASGAAPLGYGDSQTTTISYGSDIYNKHPAAWFRQTFSLDAEPETLDELVLLLRCDDGAVVYLNGEEIHRRNMPSGTITEDTLASVTVSGSDENLYFEVEVSPSALQSGENVVAVEVHQASSSSSDLTFDLSMAVDAIISQ